MEPEKAKVIDNFPRGKKVKSHGMPGLSTMEQAIVQTVAYVDMYDYPLTAGEIHRYLIGLPAALSEVEDAVNTGRLANGFLERDGAYYFLPGRRSIVDVRLKREQASQRLWPEAVRYGQLAAALPYVNMVAVTGSLAVNNVDASADIDFLIVTQVGRLWMCRAMVILLVRLAARRGVGLCPNYFLSERSLRFDQQTLYTAHEIAQMIPIAGAATYHRMWAANPWVSEFLPNSEPLSQATGIQVWSLPGPVRSVRWLGEAALRLPPGGWFERWEMNRKVSRFSRQPSMETAFSADYCKGHFDDHSKQALDEFSVRLHRLEMQIAQERSN